MEKTTGNLRFQAQLDYSSQRRSDTFLPGFPGEMMVPPSETGLPGTLEEQAHILSLLYDIGKELTSILDLEALLRAIGERVKLLVDYDMFNVMLLNNDTLRLEHVFSLKYDERIHLKSTLALGQGLCGTAAQEQRPIRVDYVRTDARYVRCDASPLVESELVVPLIVKDRVLGVLDFESTRPAAFTQRQEEMLSALASSVAIAVENARLYDELRRDAQRKQEDLGRAREVQRLLLPKEIPELPGIDIATVYLPAQELGGDFYDFLPYGDGRIAIAVGDVSGKGPAAALLAALGVGILREHAVHHFAQPHEMLADLNGHLQILGGNGRFIAMAFCVYDSASRELRISSAGFPQPLLVRKNRATPIAVTGVPLGLLSESEYDSVCLRLEPGDAVVFCSDGIHEQTNAREEQFGVEGLVFWFAQADPCSSAEKIASDVIRAIDVHAGPGAATREFDDDRTIVVLRLKDE